MKRLSLDLTGIIVLLAVGVLVPILLVTATGIVALFMAGDLGGIIAGVLVIAFAAAALGSALVAVVLTGRKARLARQQADFLASVSHELRTPLSAIRLYAQTLQTDAVRTDAAQAEHCLSTILHETEWLDVMVDRMVTWRASSRDMLNLEPELQPVGSAVDDAVERFRRLTGIGEPVLVYRVASRTPVRHDARALSCTVLNLLTNAYKYTGDDRRIEVCTRDEGGHVAIAVCDNGIGLSRRDAARIFQPFYRVAARDGRQASGIGLGLSVARHLAQCQGGSLTVASAPGAGSTFTVRLPAERAKADL